MWCRCTWKCHRQEWAGWHPPRGQRGQETFSVTEESKNLDLFNHRWESLSVLVLIDCQIWGHSGGEASRWRDATSSWGRRPWNSECLTCLCLSWSQERRLSTGKVNASAFFLVQSLLCCAHTDESWSPPCPLSCPHRSQDSDLTVLVAVLTFLPVPVMLVVVYGFWKKRHMGSEWSHLLASQGLSSA